MMSDVYVGGGFTLSAEEAQKRGIKPTTSLTIEVANGGLMSRHCGVKPRFAEDGSVRFELWRDTVVFTQRIVNGGYPHGELLDAQDQPVQRVSG